MVEHEGTAAVPLAVLKDRLHSLWGELVGVAMGTG